MNNNKYNHSIVTYNNQKGLNKKMRRDICSFFLLAMLFTYFSLITTGMEFEVEPLKKNFIKKNLKTSSSPIIITNWSDICATYDWCSFEDGFYIVSDLNLNITNGGTGLIIENTIEPFIIENCSFFSNDYYNPEEYGIELINASNGIIISNYFYSIGNSIVIKNSINNSVIVNTIDNSEIYNNVVESVILVNCSDSFIQENYISFAYNGIELDNCDTIQVFNNTLIRNGWGIVCRLIRNCTIMSNTIHERGGDIAIALTRKCYNNFIITNSISESYFKSEYQDGVVLWDDSSNNTIKNNIINDNGRYGIDIRDSLYNEIINNTLLRNEWGIRLFNSNSTIVKHNKITYYQDCILEINCELNTIEDNICEMLPKLIPGYYLWIILISSIIAIMIIYRYNYEKKYRTSSLDKIIASIIFS